ncbi:MAG TPA: hypothetical protein VG826_29605 [Pirellulales bacterium]|nr:hypothetical protein [Pirellulales bacterium]
MPTNPLLFQRLHDALAAACPIDGVSVVTPGDNATVRIDYASSATDAQKTAAQSALASFDWSDAAQAAWELAQNQSQAGTLVQATDAIPIAVRALGQACLTVDNELAAAIGQLIANQAAIAAKVGATITTITPPPQIPLATAQANVAAIISSGAANA